MVNHVAWREPKTPVGRLPALGLAPLSIRAARSNAPRRRGCLLSPVAPVSRPPGDWKSANLLTNCSPLHRIAFGATYPSCQCNTPPKSMGKFRRAKAPSNALTRNDLRRRATPRPQRIKLAIDALLREISTGQPPGERLLTFFRRAREHEDAGPHPDPLPEGEGTRKGRPLPNNVFQRRRPAPGGICFPLQIGRSRGILLYGSMGPGSGLRPSRQTAI
jgi:hypothetical protein